MHHCHLPTHRKRWNQEDRSKGIHFESTFSKSALDAFLTERIAEPPARPRRIFFVPELPLTPIGKIARYRLRQAAAAMRAAEDLMDLAPQYVECSDYGARLITIDWTTGSTSNQRTDADQRLARLGLRTQHRETSQPASMLVST